MKDENDMRSDQPLTAERLSSGSGAPVIEDFFADREREKHQVLKSFVHDDFVALVGNTGAGKTSFVSQEIVPVLKEGHIVKGVRNWKIVNFRPGSKPIEALSAALSKLDIISGHETGKVDPNLSMKFDDILRSKKYGVIEIVEKYQISEGNNILLFIDNLDDLVYYADQKDEVVKDEIDLFVDRLIEVIRQSAYPIYVIATLRTDTSSSFSLYPSLAEMINKHQFILSDVGTKELMHVFSKISKSGEVSFSKGFIKYVNEYLKNNRISLGAFKHAIRQSINKSFETGESTVDLHHLEAIGGLENSVAHQLREIYESFSTEQQHVCKRIFQAITGAKDIGDYLILPRSVEEITNIVNASSELVLGVINPFAYYTSGIIEVYKTQGIIERLESLSMDSSNEIGLTVYSEIILARDEIITDVSLLKEWVDEEYENARVYANLHHSVVMNEPLYEGEKFRTTQEWYERVKPHAGWAERYDINYDAVDLFYQRCLDKQNKLEEDLEAEENSRQQKARRTKKIVAAFLMISSVLLIAALFQINRAKKATDEARGQEARADSINSEAEILKNDADLAVKLAQKARIIADDASKEAKKARERAVADSLSAAKANREAILKQKELQQSEERLKENQELADGLKDEVKKITKEKKISKEENEYLNHLQGITKILEELDKTLKNSSEDSAKIRSAKTVKDVYLEFNSLLTKYANVVDSFPEIGAGVQKGIFSTMQRAYQEVNKKDPLKKIITSVSITKHNKNGKFLIVSNDDNSKVYQFNPAKHSVSLLNRVMDKELYDLGAHKIRFNKSGNDYIISHVPVEKDKRYFSRYDAKGNHLYKHEVSSAVLAIYPYDQNDFIIADQNAEINLLRDAKAENKAFDIELLYKGREATSCELKSNGDRETQNHLRAITFSESSGIMFMAVANKGLLQLQVSKKGVDLVNCMPGFDANEVTALKYIHGRQLLVLGNRKGKLSFYKVTKQKLRLMSDFSLEHSSNVNVLKTNEQENILVSGGRDGLLKIWYMEEFEKLGRSYQPVKFEQKDAVREVVFVDEKTIMVSSSTEGLGGNNFGEVAVLILDFDRMGQALIKLLN